MPRPSTKSELIESARTERTALEALLAKLTPDQMTQANMIGEWAIKDMLTHLIEWEQMAVRWYETGVKGDIPAVPSEEYNWGQLPLLNHSIYRKHREECLTDIQESFAASYKRIIKIIEDIPENVLFARRYYPWTRDNTLAAYFISATSSHYRWARKVIRQVVGKA